MFYDPDAFPFARELQGWWRLIRQEYLELDVPFHAADSLSFYMETVLKENGWTPSWQLADAAPDCQCRTYLLSYKGMQPDDLPLRMPTTSRLLSRLQGFRAVAISVMRPSGAIEPHAHPEFMGQLLTLHLGLELAPNSSYLRVDSETRDECAGRVLIFDGSRQHSAINNSNSDRAILYVEFCPKTVAFAPA